jgi:hypothetical protein
MMAPLLSPDEAAAATGATVADGFVVVIDVTTAVSLGVVGLVLDVGGGVVEEGVVGERQDVSVLSLTKNGDESTFKPCSEIDAWIIYHPDGTATGSHKNWSWFGSISVPIVTDVGTVVGSARPLMTGVLASTGVMCRVVEGIGLSCETPMFVTKRERGPSMPSENHVMSVAPHVVASPVLMIVNGEDICMHLLLKKGQKGKSKILG